MHIQIKTLPLSFWTAHQLCGLTELLPSRSEWQCCGLLPKVPMKSPVRLFYRDPVRCLEALFNHPLFHDKLDLVSCHIYRTAERLVCMYSEWMTGNAAWEMQVRFRSFLDVPILNVFTRLKYLLGPPSLASSFHPTRQMFLCLLAINVPTHFYLDLQIYACLLVSSYHPTLSSLPRFSRSQNSSINQGVFVAS